MGQVKEQEINIDSIEKKGKRSCISDEDEK